MDSEKDYSQSKYDKHNYHKHISGRFLKECDNYNMNKYNNVYSHTSSTLKHPFFCPTGAPCKSCHQSRKGFMKKRNNLMKFYID